MKKPQQSWATRPLPPVTVADLERWLDMTARYMVKAGKRADLYLPIWQMLEEELEKLRVAEAALAAARARLTRSPDRTAA